ncbi:MAG TPA: MmcQ/YjbR family DNA-binding protein [Stellaceae bacterium]|jgi:hypothetical protein|nr:MmcQ/YjbR family DNA-binding protein [Stellaceae bacterium]
MAVTWDELAEIARGMPGVESSSHYGTPAFKVKGKMFVRLHQSGAWAVLHVGGLEERDHLVETNPVCYGLTDHYRDYPLVLLRLETADRDEALVALKRSWRLRAPARLRDSPA